MSDDPHKSDLPPLESREHAELESRALARLATAIHSRPATAQIALDVAEEERMRTILERLGVDPEILAWRLFPPPEDRRGSPRLADEVLELLVEAGVEEAEGLGRDLIVPAPATNEAELEDQVARAIRSALSAVERPRRI